MDSENTSTDLAEKPTVLSNARNLIEGKTRFEQEEIQPVSDSESLQSYEILVRHVLDATPTTESITGHFVRESVDKNTANPTDDATEEVVTQLEEASTLLKNELAKTTIKYNQVEPGLLLKHPHKHWYLNTCNICSGAGRNICGTCSGNGQVTCHRCYGRLRVTCDGYGCNGGSVACAQCGGGGRIQHQVPYQVPHSSYTNGNQQTHYTTAYRTEYRTEYKTCSGCCGGRVMCPKCSGTAQISCPTCFATGILTCSSCAGSGKVTCAPCAGSGEVGLAAWVDVQVTQDYSHSVPDNTPEDVMAMIKKEGLHGLPPISESFNFANTRQDAPDSVLATYCGEFSVVRQDVICQGESAHLVAYGNDLRWWTLDGIIERLVQHDLNALSKTIIESTTEDIFSSRIDQLLEAFKNVAASEINIDLVEAALSDKDLTQHRGAISDEYAKSVKHGIEAALRRIYVRSAKRFAWITPLLGTALGMLVWAFEGPTWAAITAIIVLIFSIFLHQRSIRKLFADTLGSPELARRTMDMAAKGHGKREAILLLSMPSVMLAIGMGWWLPESAPFAGTKQNQASASISADKAAYERLDPESEKSLLLAEKLIAEKDIVGAYATTYLLLEKYPNDPRVIHTFEQIGLVH